MVKKYSGWVVLMALVIGLAGCGKDDKPERSKETPTPMVEPTASSGLSRVSDVQRFDADSLWQYIDGEAEIYLSYGFVELTTSEYKDGDVEVIADCYRFDTPEHAYGLYSVMRPDGPELAPFGVQGYFTGVTLEFVKGDQVVSLTAFEESPATTAALFALARQFDSLTEGTTTKPLLFGLFPTDSSVLHSDKIVAEDYLGQSGITDVYTVDYEMGGERVTLFLSEDKAGAKYLVWSQVPQDHPLVRVGDIPFDDHAFACDNEYYGTVLVGLRGGYLVGMVGYREEFIPFMSDWLESLAPSGR